MGKKKVTVTEHYDDSGHIKKITKKISPPAEKSKRMTSKQREELLIENFVGLQKVMTNLSIKFESLSDQISKLLRIYEMAARNIITGGKENDKELLDKINSLLDQNKTIAKGLVLMEEKVKNRNEFQEAVRPMPRPLPRT